MRQHILVSSSLLIGCAAAPAAGAIDRPVAAASPGATGRDLSSTAPPAAPKASAEGPAAKPEPPAPQPLPGGTAVLHVGSSSAASLGVDLKLELEKRGITSVLKYRESTYIPQWAGPTMGLAALVAAHNPDLVIVSLGGNEVAMPDPSVREEAIKRIVQTIGDRPCLWVAAPAWKGVPHTGIRDVIRANCAPCRYVDTSALVPDLEPWVDGIHPTIPARRRWAKRMIEWLIHNRDPRSKRPWDFRTELEMPPAEQQ